MVKRPLWGCVMLCLALLLAGCNPLTFQNINDQLHAPKLGHGMGEIQKALALHSNNEEPQYKYPKDGEQRSPLLLADLNGDGHDEGILVYSIGSAAGNQDKSGNVYVAVLEQNENGEWRVTQDLPGPDADVANFQTVSLLGDGTLQLVVGYCSSNLGQKQFWLYSYKEEQLTPMVTPQAYSQFAIADFAGRGVEDLVLVWPRVEGSKVQLQLKYIPAYDGVFDQGKESVSLDGNFLSCVGLYPSKSNGDKRLIVVDALMDAPVPMMVSQQLVYNGDNFYVGEYNKLRGEAMRRSLLLKSRDIDGDGIVEIPRLVNVEQAAVEPVQEAVSTETEPLPEEAAVEDESRQLFVEWIDYTVFANDTEAQPVMKQFGLFDMDRGTYVSLPDAWQGEVYVEENTETHEWGLRRYDNKKILMNLKAQEAGEQLTENTVQIPGVSGTVLVLSNGLSALERNKIVVTSLIS